MRISDWSSDVCSSDLVRYDRPDNWVELRNAQIRDLTPEQVNAAARTLEPGALTWVVVGDLKQIEQPVRALDLGEVSIIDADGNPVADAPAADKDGEYGSSSLPCAGRGGTKVCRMGRAKRHPSSYLQSSVARDGFKI